MSYLALLKQIEAKQNFTDTPDPVLTKPTQAPFVSFGSSTQGHIEKTAGDDSVGEIFTDGPVTVLTKPTEEAFVSYGSTPPAPIEKNLTSRRWLFHFTDRDPLQVLFVGAVDHSEALFFYPDAVAAEPVAEPQQRTPTIAEVEELRELIRAIYPSEDREEALAIAMTDPDGALMTYRVIVAERGMALGEVP